MIRSLVIATAGALAVALPARAASPPHPECPWVKPENSWVDFITGQVPSAGKATYYFAVRFDKMSHVPDSKRFTGDSDPLGTLWKGSCYTVSYANGGWNVSGYNEGRRRSGLWSYSNADPNQKEISLWGRVFRFTEGGEVIDAQYGHLGTLKCVLDHRACDGFAD
jgi:hypothetical protein